MWLWNSGGKQLVWRQLLAIQWVLLTEGPHLVIGFVGQRLRADPCKPVCSRGETWPLLCWGRLRFWYRRFRFQCAVRSMNYRPRFSAINRYFFFQNWRHRFVTWPSGQVCEWNYSCYLRVGTLNLLWEKQVRFAFDKYVAATSSWGVFVAYYYLSVTDSKRCSKPLSRFLVNWFLARINRR